MLTFAKKKEIQQLRQNMYDILRAYFGTLFMFNTCKCVMSYLDLWNNNLSYLHHTSWNSIFEHFTLWETGSRASRTQDWSKQTRTFTLNYLSVSTTLIIHIYWSDSMGDKKLMKRHAMIKPLKPPTQEFHGLILNLHCSYSHNMQRTASHPVTFCHLILLHTIPVLLSHHIKPYCKQYQVV